MIQSMERFEEGKSYWYEYVRVNGYSSKPTENGLLKLSKLLDIDKSHLRRMINLYLEA